MKTSSHDLQQLAGDIAAVARRYGPVSYTHLTLPTILRV